MRVAISLGAGWAVGAIMFSRYLATHAFPSFYCPIAAIGVTLLVFAALGFARRI